MTEKPSLVRCPACNPMHVARGPMATMKREQRPVQGRARRGQRALAGSAACALCQGSRLVEVAVSVRFVDALHSEGSPLTVRSTVRRLDRR